MLTKRLDKAKLNFSRVQYKKPLVVRADLTAEAEKYNRQVFPESGGKVNYQKSINMGLDYWSAFHQSQFNDVTLVFEENAEFKTCRVLLFEFFDYFRALMSSGMKDSNSDRIQVENVTKGK